MKLCVLLAAFVLPPLLCGCVPMQTAPLVYVSKLTVGANISAAATEAPGLDVTLGYKAVDAAYIPVAVSKTCFVKGNQCKEGDVTTVAASSSELGKGELLNDDVRNAYQAWQDIKSSADKKNDELTSLNNALVLAQRELDRQNELIDNAKADIENELVSKKKIAESHVGDSVGGGILTKENIDTAQALVAKLENKEQKDAEIKKLCNCDVDKAARFAAGINENIAKAKSEYDVANSESRDKFNAFTAVISHKGLHEMGTKRDAYSVYGSFSDSIKVSVDVTANGGEAKAKDARTQAATTNGTNPETADSANAEAEDAKAKEAIEKKLASQIGAGMSVGKVFSTGVASQNLTDRKNDVSECVGQIAKAMGDLTSDAQKTAFSNAVQVCISKDR